MSCAARTAWPTKSHACGKQLIEQRKEDISKNETKCVAAHRFVIGYIYGRTHSQTGGLLQIWIHRRLATLLAFQPLLLGLIFLTRDLWIEGGVLCGVAFFVVTITEGYCSWRTKTPGRKSLSPVTNDALDTFLSAAQPTQQRDIEEESTSLVSSARNTRLRGSFASVLEMMSTALAVGPSSSEVRGPVPLGACCVRKSLYDVC